MVAQLKILLGVLSLVVLGAAVLGGVYMFEKVFKPAYVRDKEAAKLLEKNVETPDLGEGVYLEAKQFMESGDLDLARAKLAEVMEVYPNSLRVDECRRVIGEINLDRLFSKSPMPGKLEYTVRRGDSLVAIAQKNRTTLAYIRQVNGLFSNVIHPNDRLILYPFDFEILIDLSDKRLSLWERGHFLKAYAIEDFKRGRGSFPGKTRIADKTAWLDGKPIRLSDSRATVAEHWLQTPVRGSSPGVVICARPKGEDADKREEAIAFGLFLSPSENEELAMLTRVGTPVTIQQ